MGWGMSQVVRIEKRKRGIFGTLVWWVFLAWNAFAALWLFYAISGAAQVVQNSADAGAQAGAAIGGTIASGFILSVWLLGSLILGLIVMLSRGKKVTIERVVN